MDAAEWGSDSLVPCGAWMPARRSPMPLISFLVPARQRRGDLLRLARHFVGQAVAVDCEVLVIVERQGVGDAPVDELQRAGARLLIVEGGAGPFHKTRLLNAGLAAARGRHVVAYDSDLLPLFPLQTLCRLISTSPSLVLGGYRVMSGPDPCAEGEERHPVASARLARPCSAPEDCAGALYKQLLAGERFMVCPVLRRDLLVHLAGWNEAYCGWGCEDQDLLERYLAASGLLPARLPDLLYLHFDHPAQSGWNDAELVQRNRAYYYRSR